VTIKRSFSKLLRNQPTGLCLHRFAVIQTWIHLYSIPESTLRKGVSKESISKSLQELTRKMTQSIFTVVCPGYGYNEKINKQ